MKEDCNYHDFIFYSYIPWYQQVCATGVPINSRRRRHLQSPTSPCLRLLRQFCLVQLLQKHLCQVSSYMRLRGERVRSSISKKIKRNAPKTMDKPLRNLTDVFPHGKQMAARRVTRSSTFKVLFCHQVFTLIELRTDQSFYYIHLFRAAGEQCLQHARLKLPSITKSVSN